MRLTRRPAQTTAFACVVVAVLVGLISPPAAARVDSGTAYANPVSRSFADTFADPAVIRGKDGWWYAYGTTDPLREGEGAFHTIPTARSRNLVDWDYVGDAFSQANMPSWAAPDAALWAPDIRYVNGEYRMYYVVTQTTATDEPNDNAVGMATAPTPTGPWTDSGAPVVGPRRGDSGQPGDFKWTFDPSAVTGRDGGQWLFYGSYYGGMYVVRVTGDGTEPVGEPTMVAIDNKFEGAYVVHRRGWWHLFASTANCCAGPTTGYSVQVGRSQDLRGPYVDRQGVPLTASRAGGTPTLVQNGNSWIGAGHNAIATDLAGQDWIVYHALDRADPYLDGTDGINERPMLLDRLDWVGGWPAVRADRGPSEGVQSGPVTQGREVTSFEDGITHTWRVTGRWGTSTERDSGRYAESRSDQGALVTRRARPGDLRVEADLRGAAGLVIHRRADGSQVAAWIDRAANRLRLAAVDGKGNGVRRSAALPAGYEADEWHAAVLEVRDGAMRAELSHARLGDPLAELSARLPDGVATSGRSGAFALDQGADVDNLSVLTASVPVRTLAPDDEPGARDPRTSDGFNGASLEPGWRWLRGPQGSVDNGVLRWPTEAADLVGGGNDASVLLRRPPQGADWTVQTKVSIDLGVDTIRNFQQAGLIAYADDDLFTRFSHVAIWNTRQTEFGKEMPYAGRLQYGGTIVGPPADTTWLRLTHRLDPDNGEHELRAWSRTSGERWVKGGVWTLPPGTPLEVGLVSHGGAGATAEFDYFRAFAD